MDESELAKRLDQLERENMEVDGDEDSDADAAVDDDDDGDGPKGDEPTENADKGANGTTV